MHGREKLTLPSTTCATICPESMPSKPTMYPKTYPRSPYLRQVGYNYVRKTIHKADMPAVADRVGLRVSGLTHHGQRDCRITVFSNLPGTRKSSLTLFDHTAQRTAKQSKPPRLAWSHGARTC